MKGFLSKRIVKPCAVNRGRRTCCSCRDMKSTTERTTPRQQDFHELKRRAFLQDNSWIKKRPEEERDENYGRVVLNRHNSHDALDRKKNDGNEPKTTISRYRSDDSLDRISDRNDAVKTHKANTLDNRLTNRSLSTFRSPETTKMKPGVSFSVGTTTVPASASATTPVKKKRQSWFPPPPPGYHAASSPGTSRREPTAHPPIPPKPSSPISSPHMLRRDNRQTCPPKPGVYTETNRAAERNIRNQDLENIVKVASSLQKIDKGEELDNLIKMNKSLNRNRGLDGLFRTNPKTEQIEKRAKSLESLIFLNARMDKDGKRDQTLRSFMKENSRTVKTNKGSQDLEPITKEKAGREGKDIDSVIKVNSKGSENITGKQDLSGSMKVNPEKTNKNIKRGQSLDNLIKVTLEEQRSSSGSKQGDNLIGLNPRTETSVQGDQNLDSHIKIVPETKRTKQGYEQVFDGLIKVNPKALKSTTRNKDIDNLIKVNPDVIISNQSSYAKTRPTGAKDTVVYTRTYVENSQSPKVGYQENIHGKYIQTVYSTSDRSVIERDMCTYCRKPLGTETKMILDELQICCHSTCFKCEICKKPLENLQAGDSIWIYKKTIHCEPCYSKVIAKWIQ